MKPKRLILKRESFGGVFVNTETGRRQFLKPEEYERKKQELSEQGDASYRVQVIDVTERGYSLLTDATSSPNNIFWELTKQCNGACTDCFMDANSSRWSRNEVSFSEIEEIVRQLIDLGGYSVRLTGGEPTQRPDFFDIVDILNQGGIEVGLNTNGMFDERKLEQILSRDIKDIRISLDGPEKINDSMRWAGNYRGAIRTIESIADYNRGTSDPIILTINVVLMRSTISHMEHMIRLAQSYGSRISFGLMRLSGRAEADEMLSPEEVVRASYTAERMRQTLGLPHGAIRVNYDIFCEGFQDGKGRKISGYAPFPFDNSKCPLGTSGLNLDAYARIASCGYFVNAQEFTGEDIRGKDLLEVWHHSPLLKMIRTLTRDGCTDCGYYKVKCNGGCPAMAYFVEGNVHGRDPYCVRDVDISTFLRGRNLVGK
ncbi:radical SAM protein [Candidatus Peregrinibacteria bacterium]|nr:radical SAM protein [Candidatus Peregrinibacteria bacterium]